MLHGFADSEHIKRERAKAKDLRQSQWWRQQIGNGVCYHCGEKFAKELLTMDHLIPVARGGKSTKNNCVVSCKDCNNKKGYKLSVELKLEEMAAKGELPPIDAGAGVNELSEHDESDEPTDSGDEC